MTDPHTHEQHAADLAAEILANLAGLHQRLDLLHQQFKLLDKWVAHHRPHHISSTDSAICAADVLSCPSLREAIRDIASTLPIRGLDYGDTP